VTEQLSEAAWDVLRLWDRDVLRDPTAAVIAIAELLARKGHRSAIEVAARSARLGFSPCRLGARRFRDASIPSTSSLRKRGKRSTSPSTLGRESSLAVKIRIDLHVDCVVG